MSMIESKVTTTDDRFGFEAHVSRGDIKKIENGNEVMYVYTDQCIDTSNWNIITKQATGIIFDKTTGKCIARSLPKIFHLNETKESSYEFLVLKKPLAIYNNLEGINCLIYHNGEDWTLTASDGFNNGDAVRGRELLEKYKMASVPRRWALTVQIVDDNCLALIGIVDRESRYEYQDGMMEKIAKRTELRLPETYNVSFNKLMELKSGSCIERSGWIMRLDDGLRVKIMGDKYNTSDRLSLLSFWENMLSGIVDTKMITDLPKEYQEEGFEIKRKLENKYDTYLESIMMEMEVMKESGVIDGHYDEPEFRTSMALYIKNNKPVHGAAFFPMIYGEIEGVDKYLMRKIKPYGNV